LRDVSTGDHLRIDVANCFYPIFVKEGKVVGFGKYPTIHFIRPQQIFIRDDGIMEVYPIDAQGNERKWVFARQTVESILPKLSVEFNNRRKVWDIIRTKRAFNYKTIWTDKPV
jgi:adenine-specific DNA-methyltransferase